MCKEKRVILVGGHGSVGRHILKEIAGKLDHVRIDVAGRGVHKAKGIPDGVGRVRLDFHDSAAAVETLAGYDFAILTMGPFEEFKSKPHKLCIEAGIDCLDVNDSLSAAYDIFSLDSLAKERGVNVLTGMGLNPGLSTFMMHSLFKNMPRGRKCIKNWLFGGAKENNGAASVMTMLSYLGPEVNEIWKGAHRMVQANDDEKGAWCRLPLFTRASKFVHCPSVEAWTLERSKEIDIGEIEWCDYRVHFQGLPMWIVRAYRRYPVLRSYRNIQRLGKAMAFLHEKNKRFMRGLPYSVYGIECSCEGRCYMAYVTGYTVGRLTALLPAVFIEFYVNNKLSLSAGIHSLDGDFFDRTLLEDSVNSKIDIVYKW